MAAVDHLASYTVGGSRYFIVPGSVKGIDASGLHDASLGDTSAAESETVIVSPEIAQLARRSGEPSEWGQPERSFRIAERICDALKSDVETDEIRQAAIDEAERQAELVRALQHSVQDTALGADVSLAVQEAQRQLDELKRQGRINAAFQDLDQDAQLSALRAVGVTTDFNDEVPGEMFV